MTALETIKKCGYFFFWPEMWDKFSNEIDALQASGIINSLADEQGFDTFNDYYIYVLRGNPRKVRYVDDDLVVDASNSFYLSSDGSI